MERGPEFGTSFGRKKFDDCARIERGSAGRQEWRMVCALFLLVTMFMCGGTLEAKPRPLAAPAPTAVLFEFSAPVSEPFWEDLKGALDQNAAPISPEHTMTWMKRQEFRDGMEYPEVVQVRLRGHCNADLRADWQSADGPLGWVYMSGGEIQPIAYVNCDRIGQTLERQIRGKNAKERQQGFARAVSRVVAHELTHIFQQSSKHSSSGLQRAYLTAFELTKEDGL